ETIALLATEQRNDTILTLHEALFLFQSEHLLAHLRFPQLDEFVGGNDVLLFEQLFDREQAGLIDEDCALMLLYRFDDRPQGLRRALDDFFEAADALEQVLIEGEVFLLLVIVCLILFECADSGENEQLVLTTEAILPFVVVECTTCLAKHGRL